MTALQTALNSSVRLSEYIGQNLGERADNVNANGLLAIALHSIALEHREATLLLIGSGAHTSCRVLARSALEAYVGASWFEHVASEEEARQFMRADRPAPKFETMAQRLRTAHPWGEVFEKLRAHYRTLNDYVHGSVRQVSRWISPAGIEPRHSDEELVEVLRFVDTIAVMACISRESISGRPIEPFTALFNDVLRGRF